MIALRLVGCVVACVVLGTGVGLTMAAGAGADGYTTFVAGVSRQFGVPFGVVNAAAGLGLLIVSTCWRIAERGVPQFLGPGSVTQPVVVGLTAGAPWPQAEGPVIPLAAGLALMSVGIAAYLAMDLGAGPVEAAALGLPPRQSFATTFVALQLAGGLIGWRCGADIGPGTVLATVLVGPAADRVFRVIRRTSPAN